MNLQGKLADLSRDYKTNKYKITFLVNNAINSLEEIENVELLDIEVKKHRDKRSDRANRYFWKLLQEICEKQSIDTIEDYKRRVRELGIFRRMTTEVENVKTIEYMWNKNGIAWFIDVFDTQIINDKEYKILHLYYGSSSFNSKQMSRLIDGLVQDCKAVGIETKSPEEIQSMLGDMRK